MSAPAAMQLEFAALIGDPARALALGIAHDNTSLGWRTASDWVEAGQAFAVAVAPWLLALDLDSAAGDNVIDALVLRLASQGREPVVLASGMPGHRHVFCWVPDPDEFARSVAVARAAGVDVRSESLIRPPGSPHRLGRQVTLLSHTTWEQARAALAARKPSRELLSRLGHQQVAERDSLPGTPVERELAFATVTPSPSLQRLISFGHSEKSYVGPDGVQDDSRLLLAIANRAVIEQISREILWGLLTSPGARGGASLTKRLRGDKGAALGARRRQAEVMFHRTYDKALTDCVSGARQIQSRPDAVAYVAAVARVARAVAWPGHRGSSLRAVIVAACEIAARHQTISPRLPVRLVAEAAGMHRETAQRALKGLVDAGWLEFAGPWSETRGICYRLKLPSALLEHLDCFDHLLAHSPLETIGHGDFRRATSSPELLPSGGRGTGGTMRDELVEQPILSPGHDVFSHQGLGKGAWRTLEAITGGAASAEAVSQQTGAHPGTVRRHVVRLIEVGLIERTDSGWEPTGDLEADHVPLDDAAIDLGVAGISIQRKDRHTRERAGYRRFCERRAAERHADAGERQPPNVRPDTASFWPARTAPSTTPAGRRPTRWRLRGWHSPSRNSQPQYVMAPSVVPPTSMVPARVARTSLDPPLVD